MRISPTRLGTFPYTDQTIMPSSAFTPEPDPVFDGLPFCLPEGKRLLFVSGIDTDAGKSVATGFYAREQLRAGVRVTTQKFIQTGAVGGSIDVRLHRRIMGIGETPEDRAGTTAPVVLPLPASPHLAAEVAGVTIDFGRIAAASHTLLETYDEVLLEGAGGLMVPLTRRHLTIDWLQKSGLPLLFVTNTKLGSINHTLLALEAVERRGIALAALLVNAWPGDIEPIASDNERFVTDYVREHFPEARILTVPKFEPKALADRSEGF